MRSKRNRLWSDNRFRLLLTLSLAVLLPATALIFVNFHHLKSIKRDKVLEGAILGDFHYFLAISEKKINQKIYAMAEEVRDVFPSPDDTSADKEKKFGAILSKHPWVSNVFLFDAEKGLLFHSQPQEMSNPYLREEQDRQAKMYAGWFGMEGKMLVAEIHKKTRPLMFYGG